jgi:hypothetical protein
MERFYLIFRRVVFCLISLVLAGLYHLLVGFGSVEEFMALTAAAVVLVVAVYWGSNTYYTLKYVGQPWENN